MHNYKSATNPENRALVEQTILEEIKQGNYEITNQKPTVVSALGAIPKPNKNEIRLIHDCSRPQGQAVNDFISTNSFKFQTLDDAIKLLGPNYYMGKIDLKHAYRSVPIHRSNYEATGLKWRFTSDEHDTFFYDKRLPFGAKSSPEIFHRLTQAVRRMMARRGFHDLVVYLDDFLVVAPTKDECVQAFTTLSKLLTDLGFELSKHKIVEPTQELTFLGVQINTKDNSLTLPRDKLDDLQDLIGRFQNKQRTTIKQLQRLAGKLNWACRVVYGGRTFLRRILDTINTNHESTKVITVDENFKQDIHWWANFLKVFNGKQLFLDQQPTVDVETDACPISAGGYFRGDWFYHNFENDSPSWSSLHITHKETLAIILAAKRWAPRWANHRVIIHSDNQAAVQIINKGTTRNAILMHELRQLFWLSATHNFHITARYVPGTQNDLADAISRLHQPALLVKFYEIMCSQYSQHVVDNNSLRNHISDSSTLFIYSRCTRHATGSSIA